MARGGDAKRGADSSEPGGTASPTLVRTANGWLLEHEQIIERPLADVFAFFERPENLGRITPDWLSFRILTPSPVPMHTGARIDYRIALFGVPMTWRTRILRHEPGRGFVDEQVSGPFARWVHEHEFRAHPRGTCMTDRVEFRPPLGALGTLAHHLVVGRWVRSIFAHRGACIAELLVGEAR